MQHDFYRQSSTRIDRFRHRQKSTEIRIILRISVDLRSTLGEPRGWGFPHPVRGTGWGNVLTGYAAGAIIVTVRVTIIGGGNVGKIRGANHHSRGKGGRVHSPKHIDRHDLKNAKHIDPTKTPKNRYWLCQGEWKQPGDCEAVERAYYREAYTAGQEAQNEKYRKKGNYSRQRTVDQVYDTTTTSPEGSLLYIGCIKDGLADPDKLWACALEYKDWEQSTLGDNYVVLTLGMHVDEKGQYHVEERGVYQYRDNDGNLRPGQNAALEAAGIPLPDKNQPRSQMNNRKMTWDAVRREKWLDILEAHGYDIERTPEDPRPHMGLAAWQAWQDAKADLDTRAAALDVQAERQKLVQSGLEDLATKNKADKKHNENEYKALEKWKSELEIWRNNQSKALSAEASKASEALKPSDIDVLNKLSTLKTRDGGSLREYVESLIKPKEITIQKSPTLADVSAAMLAAEQQCEREAQEKNQNNYSL